MSSAAVCGFSLSHLRLQRSLFVFNTCIRNPSHAMEMASRPRRTSQTSHIRTRDRLRTAARDTDRESLESTVVEDSGREGDDQEVLRSTGVSSGEGCRGGGRSSGPVTTGLELLCRSPFSPSYGGAASLLSPLQSYASPLKLQGVVGKSQAFLQAFSDSAGAQMTAAIGGDDASEYAGEEFNGSDDSDQGGLDRSLVGRKDELKKQGGK